MTTATDPAEHNAASIPPGTKFFRLEYLTAEEAERLQEEEPHTKAPWRLVENPDASTRRPTEKQWWPVDDEPVGDEVETVLRTYLEHLSVCRITYTRQSRRQRIDTRVFLYNPAADVIVDEAEHLNPDPEPDTTPTRQQPRGGRHRHRTPVPSTPRGQLRRLGPGELGQVAGVPMTPVELGGESGRGDYALAHALASQSQDKLLEAMTAVFGTCVQVVTTNAQSQVQAFAELAKLSLAQQANRDQGPERLMAQLREMSEQSEEKTRAMLEQLTDRLDEDEDEDEAEAALAQQLQAITAQLDGTKDRSWIEQFVGSDHGQMMIAKAIEGIMTLATGSPPPTPTTMKQEPAPEEAEE